MKKNEAAAKLLPADVRQRGGFTIASSVATPPSSAYLPDGRTVVGWTPTSPGRWRRRWAWS